MEKFDKLENKMIKDYEVISNFMGEFYTKIKNNPKDETSKEALYDLGIIARMMIDQRICLIDSYCTDKDYSKRKIETLEEFKVQLNKQIDESLQIGRTR